VDPKVLPAAATNMEEQARGDREDGRVDQTRFGSVFDLPSEI